MQIEFFKFTARPIDFPKGIRLDMELQASGKSHSCVHYIDSTMSESIARTDLKPLFEHVIDKLKRELTHFIQKGEK